MDIENIKEVSDKTKDGVRRRVIMNYPRAVDGKAADKINKFISDIIKRYKKSAENAPLCTYNKLTYKIFSFDPLSVCFEAERYGQKYKYVVFSVTFSPDGRAVPFLPDKKEIKAIKKRFLSQGVKISYRSIRYSYYIKDGKTVIYQKRKNTKRDIIKIISEASAYGRLCP
jgi:hypothetical protein